MLRASEGACQAPRYVAGRHPQCLTLTTFMTPLSARTNAWHQGSTAIAALSLATRPCRTAHRLGPSKARRPCYRDWRTAFSPYAAIIYELLPSDARPIAGDGCIFPARCSCDRPHSLSAVIGQASSSVWPDVVCNRHTRGPAGRNRTIPEIHTRTKWPRHKAVVLRLYYPRGHGRAGEKDPSSLCP